MAALLTAFLALGIAAPVKSAPAVVAPTPPLDCSSATSPQSVRQNQYVLLLFLSFNDAGRAAVKQAFGADWPPTGPVTPGCIQDSNSPKGVALEVIKVQSVLLRPHRSATRRCVRYAGSRAVEHEDPIVHAYALARRRATWASSGTAETELRDKFGVARRPVSVSGLVVSPPWLFGAPSMA